MNQNQDHQQQQNQPQKPAQKSSKARGLKRGERSAEIQKEALANAINNSSVANYEAIFVGFDEMGIHPDDVKPRENVFTFNAWKALGRVVRKGQHGVRIVTRVPCEKVDKATGDVTKFSRAKTTTVFHVSQTDALDAPAKAEPTEEEQALAAGFGCVAAWKDPTFMTRLSAHSEAFAQAVADEASGRPADYEAARKILDRPAVPAGAINIFDL